MQPPRGAQQLLLLLALALLPGLGQGGHPRERSHLDLFARPVGQRLAAGVFLRTNTTLLASSGDWLEVRVLLPGVKSLRAHAYDHPRGPPPSQGLGAGWPTRGTTTCWSSSPTTRT